MIMRRQEQAECERELLQKIKTEHDLFKYKMLSGTAQKIYDACKRICFYECLWEYFIYSEQRSREFIDIANKRDMVLAGLWEIYLKYEYLRADTWEDIDEILAAYVREHTEESKCRASEAQNP